MQCNIAKGGKAVHCDSVKRGRQAMCYAPEYLTQRPQHGSNLAPARQGLLRISRAQAQPATLT